MKYLSAILIWLLLLSSAKADENNIMDAIKCNRIKQVKFLVESKPELLTEKTDIDDYKKITLLHWAIICNNKPITEYLISKGANINYKDGYGATPLHIAAFKGQKEIALYLISIGADLQSKNNSGQTPLFAAIDFESHTFCCNERPSNKTLSDKREIITSMLSKGADVNISDEASDTPLIMAALKSDAATIRQLIKNGANVKAKNGVGHTALDYACLKGNVNSVEALVENGADVESGYFYYNPLMIAIHSNNSATVNYIISCKLKNDSNFLKKHSTLLHCMVEEGGLFDSIKFCIEKGADINSLSSHGQTPLHVAVKFVDFNTVEFLLSHGAKINVRDKSGKTPLKIAEDVGFDELIKYLKEKGAVE